MTPKLNSLIQQLHNAVALNDKELCRRILARMERSICDDIDPCYLDRISEKAGIKYKHALPE